MSFNTSMSPVTLPMGVIVFPNVTLFRKKQMLPVDGKNAISPLLNSDLALSMPESRLVSTYSMLPPSACTWPSIGSLLIIIPTVLGDRWRLRSQVILVFFVLISKYSCFFDTDEIPNLFFKMIRLYNVLTKFYYLSDVNESDFLETSQSAGILEVEPEENAGLNKALDTYRKLIEKKGGLEALTEKEQDDLETRIREIEDRQVVEKIEEHEPVEIPCEKGKITIGPNTLTRFEKARIMGARALQLSLGAPPFIPIPSTARISLDISMEELEQRAIPITIRRVLPNGDYQNISIDLFEK